MPLNFRNFGYIQENNLQQDLHGCVLGVEAVSALLTHVS